MKALSLRHPYAELIVQGLKTIELRSWNTKHRGKFYVHASKFKPSFGDCATFGFIPKNLEYGALIGEVELIDVKDYNKLEDGEWDNDVQKHLAGKDYRFSTKGFILKNATKFEHPIPYKGQLNFFEIPNDVVEQLSKNVKP